MATDQMQNRPAAVPKYEAMFEQQLGRAIGRIRLLDLFAALLGLVAIVLIYALLLIFLDRWMELSAGARQAMFVVLFLIGGIYLGVFVAWQFLRRVNPYYAARRLEQTLPEAKNSVVNWLDLRREPLPPAIRGAIGQRAAHDAASASVDEAISGRRTVWAGSATGVLFVALLATLGILGPGQFWSLLGRAFAPFGSGAIRSRTEIELIEPAGGNKTARAGESVKFVAAITGKVPSANRPDSPRLLFRYRLGDVYEERPLERETESEWTTVLPANQVHSGFWYMIAAGDAETGEYQVRVRAKPVVEKIEVTYHYRPYLGWRDEISTEPNLKALRGTEVALLALANRPVKEGKCFIDGKGPQQVVLGERVAGNDAALRFRFVIEQDGEYRVAFTAADGDPTPPMLPYTISALRDYPPTVELKKPGKNITLPANSVLQLEGSATDDLGVATMALRMQVDNRELQPKPYRPGKSFQLAGGGYPKMLEYKDAVELDKLKDAEDKPFTLRPQMVVEYWLEAADACDFPAPNIGESKHFKVTIGEPDKDQKKQTEQKQKAADEQKQHEKQQDDKLKQESDKQQQDGQGNQPQEKQGRDQEKGNGNNQGKQDASDKPDPQAQDAEKKLENAFNQQDQKQNEKGDSKPENDDNKKKAEPKDDGSGKDQQQKGSAKDKGDPQKNPQPGQGNGQEGKQEPSQDKGDGGQQGSKRPQKGDDKGQGQAGQKQEKGEDKQGGSGEPNAAQPKDDSQQGKQPDKANAKEGGEKDGNPNPAQQKDDGKQAGNQKAGSGDSKGPEKAGPMNDKASTGDAKSGDQDPMKAQSKPGEKNDTASGKPKGDSNPKGSDKADTKPEGANKGGGEANAKDDKKAGQRNGNTGTNANKDPSKEPEKGNNTSGPGRESDKPPERQDNNTGSGPSSEKPGEKATPKDVDGLRKAMQAQQGPKQEEAAKKLAEVARNARDEQAREQAKQALETAGRNPQSGEPKTGQPKNDGKKGPENGDGSPGEKRPGQQKGSEGTRGQDDGTDADSSKANPGKAGGQGNGPAKEGTTPGNARSGNPSDAREEDDPLDTRRIPPDERDRIKRGELLLERFDKMLEKDKKKFLEGAQLNEEDLKRLREDIARRKKQVEAREPPQRGTGRGTRTDRASSQVKPVGKARASDTEYGGPGEPPEQFRDVYREFKGSTKK
jgi:hypothetical protein